MSFVLSAWCNKWLRKTLGYEFKRAQESSCPQGKFTPIEAFQSIAYQRHNARRLEHLASLRIPVAGLRVLELGAGIGDQTSYYVDRGCEVTITEARGSNLEILSRRFPEHTVVRLDMEHPECVAGAPFDVAHCYGLLYHLANPEQAIGFIGSHCSTLFLETCVSFGSELAVNAVPEDAADHTQAISGMGCRPTRPWLWQQLQRHFAHVYCPTTQPNHEEFPLDWTAPEKHRIAMPVLQRSVFVASRREIHNPLLSRDLLDVQIRHD
jgi:Methyltransferase domain